MYIQPFNIKISIFLFYIIVRIRSVFHFRRVIYSVLRNKYTTP